MDTIRFKFAVAKAQAAVHWMLQQQHVIDLHAVLKACYFGDKEHLNSFDRPIFGATYRAMRFGPVPLEIYEMLKGESLWLAEIGADSYPWALSGYRVRLEGNGHPDLDRLSETDLMCIGKAFTKSISIDFNERTAATHGPDWKAADLGFMKYEDMIDIDKRGRLVPYLQENAKYIRL